MVNATKDSRRNKPDSDPNPADSADSSMNRAAEEIFELTKISWLLRSRRRRKNAFDLTETEFLTLDLMVREPSQTVGQLRKHVGVLPAQMSRILRNLERRGDKPLIKCAINTADRRRIDVTITEAGRKAHHAFREARVSMGAETLAHLPGNDVHEFMRILEKIRNHMLPKLEKEESQA
jgi:DNA-binding MarR family transcriptional regulator